MRARTEDCLWRFGEGWHRSGQLKKDILPTWRHVPVQDIKRADVVALLDDIAGPDARNAPQSAVHVRRLLSTERTQVCRAGIAAALVGPSLYDLTFATCGRKRPPLKPSGSVFEVCRPSSSMESSRDAVRVVGRTNTSYAKRCDNNSANASMVKCAQNGDG